MSPWPKPRDGNLGPLVTALTPGKVQHPRVTLTPLPTAQSGRLRLRHRRCPAPSCTSRLRGARIRAQDAHVRLLGGSGVAEGVGCVEGRGGWVSKPLWFWELQPRVGGGWGLSSAVIPAGRSLGFLSCRLCSRTPDASFH